ncbi:hypothetical protein C3B51_16375 [Pseudoalteromonas rubra]|uniref:DUF676 domain-containing protein n=1 Tax=Pseudoalteromonas rubra TaxID=43658 RepID=A0A4Q7E5R1_9GAMM|nr:hypothetical protein [Pseudoalteromonas rubra]RZM77508.1 hypothetical protein C3B51_16375 [Pseudoalteromonas rubra]
MKIKTITMALLAVSANSALAQNQEVDEYGLTVGASHTISMFGKDAQNAEKERLSTPFKSLSAQRMATTSSTGSTWYINSTEMNRFCEWWDGENPLGADPQPSGAASMQESAAQEFAISPQRTCRLWTEYPRYSYGYADVYLGNDNRLDKPVVVVQPYHVDISDSSYTKQAFYNDVNSGGLMSSLRNAGYDVILYRYRSQDKGIEYNADGVKRLLEVINSKSGVSSTSFVGLSMGGVVTRFALREIEKTGSLNNVATFISFDAPHLGANFPRSILDNTNRLLDKVDSSLCGLSGTCREARRKLEAIKAKLNTKTFKELIMDTPSGSSDRSALLSKLAGLGHVQTVPTLAITNGAQSRTQGAPTSIMTSHFKLHRKWYNGGSKYFKVYTKPSVDNVAGGYADFYQVFSDLIAEQEHPITPYVTIGQKHSFVSTRSALAGSANYWDEVAAYPSNNEAHMTLTYTKARKIREWLDRYQN